MDVEILPVAFKLVHHAPPRTVLRCDVQSAGLYGFVRHAGLVSTRPIRALGAGPSFSNHWRAQKAGLPLAAPGSNGRPNGRSS